MTRKVALTATLFLSAVLCGQAQATGSVQGATMAPNIHKGTNMKRLALSLLVILQGVAMCTASEYKQEGTFKVSYQLMRSTDLQNALCTTNAPAASSNSDVYVFGSIQGGKGMMQGGRPMVEIAFSSPSHKALKGTSRVGWISISTPTFFLVRLGSFTGDLADLKVKHEVSILMRK